MGPRDRSSQGRARCCPRRVRLLVGMGSRSTMSHASSDPVRRKDIEGLRAIGMSLVAICHIWVGKVSGGVDVFFVISAYLMTGSLIAKISGRGEVDPLAFWGRIALRICPTAFILLFLTLIAGIFLEPISLWRSFAIHGWMSLIQLENLQLLRESTDYLARGQPASPFQQYWALSTQMQFYAFLPPWLFLVSRLSHKIVGRFDDRRVIALACGVLGLGSFGFAVWILALNPAPHYFNPVARLWEFMAGCVCACIPAAFRLQREAAGTARSIGLALIILCVWVVPVDAPYPGLAALMPVTGAALVLIAGSEADAPSLVRRLLETPLLQGLARLSFAFYLAHWPILTFFQERAGTARLDFWQGGVVIALALFLAAAVHRLVERPGKILSQHWTAMPSADWISRLRPLAAAVLLAAPCGVFLAAWQQHFGVIARDYAGKVAVKPVTGPIRELDRALPADIDRQLIAAKGMLPELYYNGCDTGPHSSEARLCTAGNPDPEAFTILLVGGSHSTQWYPALEPIAKERGWRLLTITKSACPIDGVYIGPRTAGSEVEDCRQWAKAALEKAIRLRPDLVVTTATRPGSGNVGEVVPEGFVRAWRKLSAHGIGILAIRDNPRPETYSVPECVDRNRKNPRACDMLRARHISAADILSPVLKEKGVTLWDIANLVCGVKFCPVIRNGLLVYNDNSHFSVPFVEALRSALERQLKAEQSHRLLMASR